MGLLHLHEPRVHCGAVATEGAVQHVWTGSSESRTHGRIEDDDADADANADVVY